MVRRTSAVVVLSLLAIAIGAVIADEREEMLRRDREVFEDGGGWVYNDLRRGIAEAKKTRKPLFVTVRCVP